jgi:hypothetical protein
VPGLPELVARTIRDRAAGIPLYAVETVRMLMDQGQLRRDGDRYRVEGEVERLAVPETLHALISARLDALEPAQRALLQAASILGQSFQLPALAAVAGESQADLAPRLGALVERQLLVVDRDPRSPERGQHQFTQSLVREVAHQTLARRDRRERHLAAARYFEALGDEELAGVLAAHYVDAYRATPSGPEAEALAAQARVSLKAAAERAASLHSLAAALAYVEQALEVTSDTTERTALQLRAAHLALQAGRTEALERHLEAARAGYRELGDRLGLASVVALEGEYRINTGPPEGIELLERELSEFADLADEPAVIRMQAQLARAYMLEERSADAAALSERVLAAAGPLELTDIVGDVLVTRGSALGNLRRWHEGVAMLRGAVQLADERRHFATAMRARNNLASIVVRARPDEAFAICMEAAVLAERYGLHAWRLSMIGNLGNAALQRGDWDGWAAMTDGAEPIPRGIDDWLAMIKAAIAACRGDRDHAARLAADAEPRMRAAGAQPNAFADWIQGLRSLADADPAGAHDAAVRAAGNHNFVIEATAVALHAASWLRDAERVDAALHGLDASGMVGGQVSDALHLHASGTAQALSGRASDAKGMLLSVVAAYRQLGNNVDAALVGLALPALLGARDADISAAEADGRAILERERASALLSAVAVVSEPTRRMPTPSVPSASVETPIP